MSKIKKEWVVLIPAKVGKQRQKLPAMQEVIFKALIQDLSFFGPVQGSWPNYSKLGKDKHHCHLSHKWVACWEVTNRVIGIYYVGSRKDAPYK